MTVEPSAETTQELPEAPISAPQPVMVFQKKQYAPYGVGVTIIVWPSAVMLIGIEAGNGPGSSWKPIGVNCTPRFAAKAEVVRMAMVTTPSTNNLLLMVPPVIRESPTGSRS
jgi:hypothetical protein